MDKWIKRWLVLSSNGAHHYIVGQDKDGNWGCGCPGWTKHFPRRDCRHIIEVKAGGGQTLEDAVLEALTANAPWRKEDK